MGNVQTIPCVDCGVTSFEEYVATGTERLTARSDTIWFSLCGAPVPCLTDPEAVQAAVAAGTFKIITCGRVNLGDATPNTETNDLGCVDTEDTKDYTLNATFRFPWRLENDPFWEQICRGEFDAFGWKTCEPNGVVFCPESVSGFKAQVVETDNNDFLETTGTITWGQKCSIINKVLGHEEVFALENCCG